MSDYSVPYEYKTSADSGATWTSVGKSVTTNSDLGPGRVGHLIDLSDELHFSPPLRRITNMHTASGAISIVEAVTGDTIVLPNVPAGGSVDHDILKINETATTAALDLKIFAQQ